MTTLRQRLLLVAGWVFAAVGAGLVASGAVAVAGGQVLDRPLRPLTAAEVAALPVVEVEAPDALEPHASGGLGSTTGDSTSGSDDADGSDEPSGAGGSTASPREPTEIPPEPSDAPTDEPVDPVLTADSPDVAVVTTAGGRASFVEANGTLLLLWATPGSGFAMSGRTETPTSIGLAFSSAREVWVIEAVLEDGSIVVTATSGPL